MLDFIAPTFKVDQVVLPDLFVDMNYMHVPRVDRCMTCHVAANRPGFDGPEWKEPFRTHPKLAITGVLLTMYDARLNLSRQVAADARDYFGSQVFETVVPRNIRLAEAPSFGKPIVLYDVQSIGAQAYMAIANELIAREPEPSNVATMPDLATSATAGEERG